MYLKYLQSEKLMEKTLKKDDKFGGKDDQTKLKNDKNLEGKCTKMRPIAG